MSWVETGTTSYLLRGAAALVVAAVALPAVAAAAADEVVATLAFDPAELEFDWHDGYDVVSLRGAEHLTVPADPMLPALHVQLLLPPGRTAAGVVAVTRGTVSIPGDYVVLPSPRPARFSSGEAAEVPQPNSRVYNSGLPYPREVARLAGVGTLGGYTIADVEVTPVQYVPTTGELFLHREIEIAIETAPSRRTGGSLRPNAGLARIVSEMVENPRALADYASAAEGRGCDEIDYLIVSPEAFADEFDRLAEWKTARGVRTEVVTLESILGDDAYAGVDDAEAVRNCIRHYYEDSGITWVLLGGDTDVVPARDAYDFFYDQGIPCDLYYADLDGTWDEDGDGRWGEWPDDAVDMYSDVFVGRAPVSTVAEAAAFVDKVLAYEGASFFVEDDFQLRMLFLGEILWDSPDPYTDGAVACDMIDDEYVPARFDPTVKLYERDGSLDLASTLAALEGGCGIVMHEGHSNIAKASVGPDDLYAGALDGLRNGARGGVWYSVGCWSAAIDHDAFGEHWLTNPAGGGVAYVGNSRYGWGCPGYPGQCVSDLYSQQFFRSLFEKGLVHAGLVHADAKNHFVGLAKLDDYMRYAMYELNLLGDPEMPIWTDWPRRLSVAHEVSIGSERVPAELSVVVTSEGSPVEGAVVCAASSEDGFYEVAETDAAGRAAMVLNVSATTSVSVTVTAENAVPLGLTVELGGSETGIEGDPGLGQVTALLQNSPNPFNPMTNIAFSVAQRSRVAIAIYDVGGRRVATLIDEEMEPGVFSVSWDGRDEYGREVASGTYFVRMTTEASHFERKMTLMR